MSQTYIKPLANKQKRLRDVVIQSQKFMKTAILKNIISETEKLPYTIKNKTQKDEIRKFSSAVHQAVQGSIVLHYGPVDATTLVQPIEVRSLGETRVKLLNIHADGEQRKYFSESIPLIEEINSYSTKTMVMNIKWDEDNGEIFCAWDNVDGDTSSFLGHAILKTSENIINEIQNKIDYLQGRTPS